MTPGARFLGHILLRCTIVVAAIAALRHFVQVKADIHISWTLLVLGGLGSLPFLYFLVDSLNEMSMRRRAAALGARLAPRTNGRWPANIDLLIDLYHKRRNDYPAEGHMDMFEPLGPTISLKCLGEENIYTIEPAHIKTVLATDFTNYVKGAIFQEASYKFLGTGVFNADGDMWKYHRSMTRPFFSRDRVSDFGIFNDHTEDFFRHVKARLNEGYSFDFQDAVGRFTMDSATEFLFGKSVDSMSAGLPYPHFHAAASIPNLASSEQFVRAFNKAQQVVDRRAFLGTFWKLLEITSDGLTEPMKTVDSFVLPILDDAIARYKSRNSLAASPTEDQKIQEDETLLSHLLRLTNDRSVIKDEMLSILLAGRDTTMNTLTFAVYALATNPHILSKLRQEIIERLGKAEKPEYDDIREMKYLRAVINETLRLYPAVPFDSRRSINDSTLPPIPGSGDPRPIFVPRDTDVPYCVFLMHRRKDLWGPDAEEFDPERWLDARAKTHLAQNPFMFLPFNAGPRICLGQQFAYNEMSYFLIRLLQTFSKIDLDPSSQPPESIPPPEWKSAPGRKAIEQVFPKSHLTLYCHGGLWLRMYE